MADRMRRVLLCGGPLHGQRWTVPEHQDALYCVDAAAVPPMVEYLAPGEHPHKPVPVAAGTTYRIKRLPIAVLGLDPVDVWVGVPEAAEGTPAEGAGIIRAFIRDDVLDLLASL